MSKYIILTILVLLIGLFTRLAVVNFEDKRYFNFGVDVAWDIWWVLKLIMLALEW